MSLVTQDLRVHGPFEQFPMLKHASDFHHHGDEVIINELQRYWKKLIKLSILQEIVAEDLQLHWVWRRVVGKKT